MIGSSIAWWLTRHPNFNGSVLVVERDPTYEFSSTAHTNSCIRQQFTTAINIKISQFGADFIHNFQSWFGNDPQVPQPVLQNFGYMYLAANDQTATALKTAQQLQAANGAATRHMMASEIAATYPFYHLDDIIAGNHNLVDEGYFDGATIFDWFKRAARENGAEYISNEVVDLAINKSAVSAAQLASGETIHCGMLINATGPRAAQLAAMAGIELPIEPRKRYSYVFEAENPLDRDLPLTIDPTGIHVRSEGAYYLAGCTPNEDPAVEPEDFVEDHSLWQEKAWPAIAHRIPQFEAIKLRQSWVGHYAYNTFDQNAIIGPHPQIGNFIFANGFSGHGFQQAPAVGRAVAELIIDGAYQTLDLSPFAFERIAANTPVTEGAII